MTHQPATTKAAARIARHPVRPPDPHYARRAGSLPDRRIGLAPAAWATFPPPEPPVAPPPSAPPAAAAAHLPPWVVVAMVAGVVVLSVATTLITLSLEHLHRAHSMSATATEPPVVASTPATTDDPGRGGRDPQQPRGPGRLRHVPGQQPLKEQRWPRQPLGEDHDP
jgi:hypothetical protein